jgi:6-phosphogluconolactonase
MPTRRRFLVLSSAFFSSILPSLTASAQSFVAVPFRKKKPLPPLPIYVYFGTDTTKGVGKGIYRSRFDPVKGQLTAPVLAAATARPSFLALSPMRNGHRFLYAVNAINDPGATVTTFAIDSKTGALNQAGQVSSGGADPVYLSVDATGNAAFVADYAGSSVASFRIQPNGTISQPVEKVDFKDTQKFGTLGPVSARQDAPHPHSATISPDNRFLLVCDLGTDHIAVFAIDPETARLTQTQLFTNTRPGSGPRHIAFHPNGRWVYGINEIDSTINQYLWTATRFSEIPEGLLINTINMAKTIAPNFPSEKNTAAELAIAPDGAFLYASNRGEDTLVVFSIHSSDGRLTLVQRISCGGKGPRQFTLSSTGQWLLCGNEDSGTVTVFRRDAASGKLSGPTQSVPLGAPLFTLFA